MWVWDSLSINIDIHFMHHTELNFKLPPCMFKKKLLEFSDLVLIC